MRKRPGSESGGLSTFSRFLEATAASDHLRDREAQFRIPNYEFPPPPYSI